MDESLKPLNHSPGLPFKDLVQYLLQPLQDYTRRPGVKGRPGVVAPSELKRVAISKFLARWRTEVGDDVFPFFRLLMPERDKDRSMYKIKEVNMAKLFIKILGISPASKDAISIEKWKIPGASGAAGDFPGRLFEVLRSRAAIPDWGYMSIDEVNEGLDQLSRCTKESQQRPILTNFYNKMSAQELRWLCCIILRTMKIGASERTIFDIWHPDAHKLFNKSSSLSRVCWELYDRDHRLPDAEKDISVFSCFQPQLAAFKKSDIADVVKKMGAKVFYIEEKLDGERIQLHKQGDTFKYWSRKAKDYTYLYGNSYGDESNQEGGGLTKYLADAFNPNVQSVVLDGEMITWNDKFDAPVGFGSLKSAANAEKNNSNSSFDGHPFYCVFDILYLNGTSLTNYTLRDRRKALKGIIRPVTRRIEVVPVQEASKEFEVESRLRECIANASEGLVVKDPDSAYRPNDRNDSWIKVKPEYMEEFGENLDLLIIGGYWGEGRRGNRLSSFLCGVREDNKDGAEPVPKFMTFARVGGGFNGPDYAQIDHITSEYWQKFDVKHPPSQFYQYAYGRNGVMLEHPDMWIAPEHSVVIQLKAASAVPSDSFATKVTLRFPRFERLREDKDWRTATSLREFIDIQAQAATEKNEKALNAHIRRKRTTAGERKKVFSIQGAEESMQDEEKGHDSSIFDKMHFYVLTESKQFNLSKNELEVLLKENGGTIVHSEGEPRTGPVELTKPMTAAQKRKRDASHFDDPQTTKTWTETFIIAERKVVKVASLLKRGLHDILQPSWVMESIASKRVLDKEPRLMYFTTPGSEETVKGNVDRYNDSFTNDISIDTLRTILKDMPDEKVDTNDINDLREALLEISDFPMWLFSRFVAYFNHDHLAQRNRISSTTTTTTTKSLDGTSPLETVESLWKSFGGRVSDDIHDPRITHIVMDKTSTENLTKIRSVMALRDKVARIVSHDWIKDCIQSETILSEERYTVR